jgi:Type VI secretion system/phage-baseplate injector OB domain
MSMMGPSARQYWGKYRGKVVDNLDPLAMGRLLVEVPQVPASAMNWAMPCVPYAGPQLGFFAMPDLDANIWVEFEGGDPGYPIWTGCYWAEGEAPLPAARDPFIKVFQTESNMLIFDDTPGEGGITMVSKPPAVDDVITLKFSSEGVLLTAPPAIFNMSIEEGITLEFPPGVFSMSEAEISATIPPSSIVLSEEAAVFTAPDINLVAEAAVEIEAGAELSLAAPSISAEGAAMELTIGATEWTGDVNVLGAMQIEGNMMVDGAVEFVGEHNIVGATQIEGDFNVLGAMQVEGAVTVLGIITMDGMPVMVFPL